jgi:hypothetical protein
LAYLFSTIVFVLGPAFYFLYLILPSEFVGSQVANQAVTTTFSIDRITGAAPVGAAVFCFLMALWGVRGSLSRPWRLAFLAVAVVASTFAGFRSITILFVMTFMCQFLFEGLLFSRYLFALLLLAGSFAAAIVLVSDRLPLQAQRSVSFLPVKLDPAVRADALGSLQWRLDMWNTLVPEVPKYFFMGKGYAIDPTDIFLANDAAYHGLESSYELSKIAGDYHSGPFSLILPFGIWGVLGFAWLVVAGTKVLYLNYRNGEPALKTPNVFLLSYFVAKTIFFFTIFGAFNSDLFIFTGILGLSISLNSGVRRAPAPVRQAAPVAPLLPFAPQMA